MYAGKLNKYLIIISRHKHEMIYVLACTDIPVTHGDYFLQIKSYGGYLKYQVLFTLPRDDEAQNTEGLVKPDVILVVSWLTFHVEILNKSYFNR